MRKIFILLVLGLLTLQVSHAAPRTLQQAKAIAERQAKALGIVVDQQTVQYSKAAPGLFSDLDAEEPYYVFNNGDNRGFTIVSGDDLLPEIVGYSDRGTFTSENMPVQLKDFLDGYKHMVADLLSGDSHAKSVVMERNNQLLTAPGSSPVHTPLLGTIVWDQGSPFNNLTPMKNGAHSVTGCVATALAQIMAYYKYPSALMEDIPAYTTSTNGYEMPSISKGQIYDWDNILDTYLNSSEYNDTQALAVAKLMLHVGCALKTNYGNSGSGANSSTAGEVLAKYFGYDPDNTTSISRKDVTQQEWNNIIYGELEALRPVLVSGSNSIGHAFICDGSDSNGLFHINWGWGGRYNGYFDITTLCQYQAGIIGGDDGFNRGNSIVCGIAPDNGIKDAPIHETPTISGLYDSFNIDVSERADASGKFNITAKVKVFNHAWEKFDGYIALKARFADGEEKIVSDCVPVKIKARVESGSYYYTIKTIPVEYAFPEGVTALEIVYSTDKTNFKKTKRWSTEYPVRWYVCATATTLSTDNVIRLAADLSTDFTVYTGMANTFKLKLTNSMPEEYLDKINVRIAYADEMPADPSFYIMATVPANGSVTRSFNFKPTEAGTLYVWMSDSEDNVLAKQSFTVEPNTDPVLVLTSVTNNAKAGLYETEKAYYKSKRVKVPKSEDDFATFTYKVKNNGGTTYRTFYVKCISVDTGLGYRYPYTRRIESGEELTFEITVKLSDMDTPFLRSNISLEDEGDGVTLQFDDKLEQPRLYSLDENGNMTGGYYYFNKNYSFIYLDPTSTGINSAVDTSNNIIGGEGVIYITSDKAARLNVVNLGGQTVRTVSVEAGQTATVSVAPGIYVVDGVKVVVR